MVSQLALLLAVLLALAVIVTMSDRIHDAKISPHRAGVYALDRDRPVDENVSIRR